MSLCSRLKRLALKDTGSRRQTLSTPGSTGRYDLPSGFCSHTDAKTMAAFSLNVAGLIGLFHYILPAILLPQKSRSSYFRHLALVNFPCPKTFSRLQW